ncbi:hypothetical protein SEVIR_5G007866v4 [Setaria viridis]|uniref:DUF1618 domain-containing protein n=1 Tax=Setaria viridis TaxID=4556 RepID=A0A4U6U8A9_SETVI|nr:hypothetical protein SEVIR_5G007866v2 [Setaria viridis]
MVAELSVFDGAATLRCFSTETSRWTQKDLHYPPIKRQWCSAYALSYRGRLWWVDLLLGLLVCDPFADNPELRWVPLPSCYRLRPQVGEGHRKGLSNDRCVSLSCGKLRLVVISRRTHQPRIKLWTLADYEAGKWSLDFDIPHEHIGLIRVFRTLGFPRRGSIPTISAAIPVGSREISRGLCWRLSTPITHTWSTFSWNNSSLPWTCRRTRLRRVHPLGEIMVTTFLLGSSHSP